MKTITENISIRGTAFLLMLFIAAFHAMAERECADPLSCVARTETVAEPSEDADGTRECAEIQSNRPYQYFNYTQTCQWRDYKRLRTLGWTFFGVGVPLTAGSYALLFAAVLSSEHDARILAPLAGITFLAGGFMTLASIPILTVAYVKRHKAKHMQFDLNFAAVQPPVCGLSVSLSRRYSAPALGLSLSF